MTTDDTDDNELELPSTFATASSDGNSADGESTAEPAQRDPTPEEKSKQLHVAFSPIELRHIDDYRFAARLASRSDTIRLLMKISLSGRLPKRHLAILKKIYEERLATAAQSDSDINAGAAIEPARVHVTLTNSERIAIINYHHAAKQSCRAATVRQLVSYAVLGELPAGHLAILETLNRDQNELADTTPNRPNVVNQPAQNPRALQR